MSLFLLHLEIVVRCEEKRVTGQRFKARKFEAGGFQSCPKGGHVSPHDIAMLEKPLNIFTFFVGQQNPECIIVQWDYIGVGSREKEYVAGHRIGGGRKMSRIIKTEKY